jgi:hypothetical protein
VFSVLSHQFFPTMRLKEPPTAAEPCLATGKKQLGSTGVKALRHCLSAVIGVAAAFSVTTLSTPTQSAVVVDGALAASAASTTRHVYRIVGDEKVGTQSIPEPYVRNSMTRWSLTNLERPKPLQPSPVHRVLPSLDFVVKRGVPAYVLVGLQSIAAKRQDGQSPVQTLAHLPRVHYAQQWMTFDSSFVNDPSFRIVVYYGSGDGTDDRLATYGSETVQDQLQQLGRLISGDATTLSPDSPGAISLEDGFHIVSVPCSSGSVDSKPEYGWIDLPDSTCASRTDGNDETVNALRLTVVGTSAADAREILTYSLEVKEQTAASVLSLPIPELSRS